jgi:non-lysosomal glucosylceramidase
MKYSGRRLREISFPLGGIGSGCIGLAGNGRLVDWEIFNRPNKGSVNGFSHIAVKAERGGRVLDARVLAGDFQPPYSGQYGKEKFRGFGYGPYSETMAGFPHFEKVRFDGTFPTARIDFSDPAFPGRANLLAFNPFIPLNDRDSSIPAAFFEISLRNTDKAPLDYTVCFSVKNPFDEKASSTAWAEEGLAGIAMGSDAFDDGDVRYGDVRYGDMTLCTDAARFSAQESWYRSGWFDPQTVFWQEFCAPGPLRGRACPEGEKGGMSSLAAHLSAQPGETVSARFVLSWNFPNNQNYWDPVKCGGTQKNAVWKNYYAVLFRDSRESGEYSLRNWERLYKETELFRRALYSSTLSVSVLDAVGSNLAVLKSPTVLRLEDGSFYGWEGVHEQAGSCEGSCTHVWNYACALPFLFPKLEKSMRSLDYKYNQREDGGMVFRLKLPPGREKWNFRPCADGQFGGVVKTYRDWKICGDDEWLRRLWPQVRRSIEFAWSEDNADAWDRDRDGVLEGRQHHTLDMELFGPSSWLEGFYLAALRAGAEMAQAVGDDEAGKIFSSLFERGRKWTEENLFNGEYYQQKTDLRDRSLLERFERPDDAMISGGSSVTGTYWNSENGELKYQIGGGCEIDQVCAQWHADIAGLGRIFRSDRTRTALKSLFENNFLRMRDICNPCRVFAVNDEKGLVICTWPHEGEKPEVPIPYAQECMTGYEYAAAAQMIYEGLPDEGLEIVRAVRGRYDGEKRNPWNEIECGSNYARSMASYSLLLAASGFSFDMTRGMIGFAPRLGSKKPVFRCLWSLEPAWGIFESRPGKTVIRVLRGSLSLREVRVKTEKSEKAQVLCGRRRPDCTVQADKIIFSRAVTVGEGQSLTILGGK